MLSQRHDRTHLDDLAANTVAQAAQPALRMVDAIEAVPGEQSGSTCGAGYSPRSVPIAEPEQASKFINGLSIALPLSICLWAVMIWGVWAIW